MLFRSNPGTTVMGVDIVGGSTTSGAISLGLRIAPLGIYATPQIPWTTGIQIDDGAAQTAIVIGGATSVGTVGGAGNVVWYYNPTTTVRAIAMEVAGDASGNISWNQGTQGALFDLCVGGAAGVATPILSMQKTSGGALAMGFFGAAPAGKPNITGSVSTQTSTVLSEVITALANLGLVTNSTTA